MIKKTIIAAGIAMAMSTGAQANSLTAGSYNMTIKADGVSCFTFGNCSTAPAGSNSYFINNDNDLAANTLNTDPVTYVDPLVGSADAVNPSAGVIGFDLDAAGNMTITSYQMDTYIATSGGYFATMVRDTTGLGGTIIGDQINFSLTSDAGTGRTGLAQFFNAPTSLGESLWNAGGIFTTGTQTNPTSGAVISGTALGAEVAGVHSAVVISNGLVGPAWGFFNGTPYSEVFSVDIQAVPVPAAVWLFGSGLLGLVGVARRKKA